VFQITGDTSAAPASRIQCKCNHRAAAAAAAAASAGAAAHIHVPEQAHRAYSSQQNAEFVHHRRAQREALSKAAANPLERGAVTRDLGIPSRPAPTLVSQLSSAVAARAARERAGFATMARAARAAPAALALLLALLAAPVSHGEQYAAAAADSSSKPGAQALERCSGAMCLAPALPLGPGL
jgi:phosphopantetheinyl transferase (holo-ACP synthase)